MGRDIHSEMFVFRSFTFRKLSTTRVIIIGASLANGESYVRDIVSYVGENTYTLLRCEHRGCGYQYAFWGRNARGVLTQKEAKLISSEPSGNVTRGPSTSIDWNH